MNRYENQQNLHCRRLDHCFHPHLRTRRSCGRVHQTTTITFSQSIQIPGQVLPTGTYVFKLANGDFDRNIVQVFNADETALYAALQTITAERQKPTGHTAIVLAEQGGGQPDALLKWFYPGHETGNEFLYPKEKEKELAHDRQQTVVTNQPTASNSDASSAGN